MRARDSNTKSSTASCAAGLLVFVVKRIGIASLTTELATEYAQHDPLYCEPGISCGKNSTASFFSFASA